MISQLIFVVNFIFSSKGNSYRVPRHDKKENNQLSPVKKRVKESSPPHQQRYNRASHVSPQYHNHHNCNYGNNYSGSGNNGGAIISSASSNSKYLKFLKSLLKLFFYFCIFSYRILFVLTEIFLI